MQLIFVYNFLSCFGWANVQSAKWFFWVDSLGFSTQTTLPFTNRDSFISSFTIYMSFISISCSFEVARASILCWIAEMPCSQSQGETIYSFTFKYNINYQVFFHMFFIKLKKLPSVPSFLRILGGSSIVSKASSALTDKIMLFFFFSLSRWWVTLIDFWVLN